MPVTCSSTCNSLILPHPLLQSDVAHLFIFIYFELPLLHHAEICIAFSQPFTVTVLLLGPLGAAEWSTVPLCPQRLL